MENKMRLEDESGDRRYFTIIPNYILNNSSANSLALYIQLKRLAGEKGETFCSRQYLMDKLKLTRPTVVKELNALVAKGWIAENGERVVKTKGGVQKVKSYRIVDLWQANNEYYQGGKKEAGPQDKGGKKEIVPRAEKGPKGVNEGGKKEADKEEPLDKEPGEYNTAEPSSAGVVLVIDSFKEINPSYRKWYGNTTQRKAIKGLLDIHGLDKILKVVALLPGVNGRRYFPTITTPLQLEDKWAALESAFKRLKASKEQNYVL